MTAKAPTARAKPSAAVRLADIAASLNARQKAYLLTAFDIDQDREANNTGFHAAPARTWRWIEYGPNTEAIGDGVLRRMLREQQEQTGLQLIDKGSGATLAVLYNAGLMESELRNVPLFHIRYRRQVQTLFVKLTPDGRKVARLLRGMPLTKPGGPKPLTLSALRLIAWGQQHPGQRFHWSTPWEGSSYTPDYFRMLAITRGMAKRGLVTGDASSSMRLTPAGEALDVTKEENWEPMRDPGAGGTDQAGPAR